MGAKEKIEGLLQDILDTNKPSGQEAKKVVDIVDEFISKLDKRKEKLGIKVSIMLGGSVAKGTFLKTKFDSDVFLRFDRSYPDEELSGLLEKILKPWKKAVKIHGSRDYFQILYKGVNFELVPVYKITKPSQAVNVTDASPLHVNWVKTQLKQKSHLRDDVRLAKMFFKSQGVYGAESYIQGFSGHVTDILIIYHDGFLNLLKAVSKWKDKVEIDVMGHGSELNVSKIYSPLVLIDPVQPDRNAAAALSKEKFDILKESAKKFLESPSMEFFEEKKLDLDELKDIAGKDKLIVINVTAQKGKADIIGCRLLKGFEYIKRHLGLNDFEVLHSGWHWNDKAIYWFIIKNVKLNLYKKWIGPPLKSLPHVEAFKLKHKKTFEEEGRICAKVKREFLVPEDFIKNVIKEDYMKTKVKRCRMK